MEMLTISGNDKILSDREPMIQGLFPEGIRPYLIDKPTVFLTSRVHPGETPASYVLDGLIKFLLTDSEQASILLSKFTFKIVPMLNPDGVYRGYFRLDTLA